MHDEKKTAFPRTSDVALCAIDRTEHLIECMFLIRDLSEQETFTSSTSKRRRDAWKHASAMIFFAAACQFSAAGTSLKAGKEHYLLVTCNINWGGKKRNTQAWPETPPTSPIYLPYQGQTPDLHFISLLNLRRYCGRRGDNELIFPGR